MDTPEIIVRLDDNSRIHVTRLQDGAWSLQRFKSCDLKDGHGWMLVATGTVSAATVGVFLAASEPLPPRAA